MQRLLNNSRNKMIESHVFFNYLFYFLRYYPLIVLSNDWFLFSKRGLFYFLSKLSFVDFIGVVELGPFFINSFIITSIIMIAVINFQLRKEYLNIEKQKMQITKIKKLLVASKFSLIFLSFIGFYFL